MRTSIQQVIAGASIGMGLAMVIGFVKFLLADKFYLSNDLLPLRFGVTAIIMAILMGIVGGIIGLIVGAFGLRTYQGAMVGLLFAALGWPLVYASICNLARTILLGRVNPRPIWDHILILSMFLDFVIVGALVSVFVRRLFAR
ncbi:MAG TPA: hypothetical protein VGD61_28095 [Pyrinomonadaceae bacterium]